MHPRTLFLLGRIGLSEVEMEHLNVGPILRIPHDPNGYGLIGGTGTGKTCHLAWGLAQVVEGIVQDAPDPNQARLPCGGMRWVNWPAQAETFKRWVAIGYHRELDDLVADYCAVRQLFLDDLGRERIAHEHDYGVGILSEIIDYRYRHRLPVYWTSNFGPGEILAKYRGALTSRLLSTWPPITIKGRDLRLPER